MRSYVQIVHKTAWKCAIIYIKKCSDMITAFSQSMLCHNSGTLPMSPFLSVFILNYYDVFFNFFYILEQMIHNFYLGTKI